MGGQSTWRKGHRNGILLCDPERGRVVDLLPERDSEALAQWLQEHPSVKIVARDRYAPYIEAISRGAPKAIQVADRWHLMKNLTDALQKILEREHASSPSRSPPRPGTG